MVERTFTLNNETGLHARPASVLVQTVQKYPGTEVFLRKGEREVNARSLLSILSLGVTKGDTLTVRSEGPQETEVLEALAALIAGGLGE